MRFRQRQLAAVQTPRYQAVAQRASRINSTSASHLPNPTQQHQSSSSTLQFSSSTSPMAWSSSTNGVTQFTLPKVDKNTELGAKSPYRTDVKDDTSLTNTGGGKAVGYEEKVGSSKLKTKITWGPTLSSDTEDGTWMKAFPLGPDHPLGSAPTGRKNKRGSDPLYQSDYPWVNQRDKMEFYVNNAKAYRAGHLLNDHLGGPGNDARNLAAITGSANSQHSNMIEERVKYLVNNLHTWVYYNVDVKHYGSIPIQTPLSTNQTSIQTRPVKAFECEWGLVDESGAKLPKTDDPEYHKVTVTMPQAQQGASGVQALADAEDASGSTVNNPANYKYDDNAKTAPVLDKVVGTNTYDIAKSDINLITKILLTTKGEITAILEARSVFIPELIKLQNKVGDYDNDNKTLKTEFDNFAPKLILQSDEIAKLGAKKQDLDQQHQGISSGDVGYNDIGLERLAIGYQIGAEETKRQQMLSTFFDTLFKGVTTSFSSAYQLASQQLRASNKSSEELFKLGVDLLEKLKDDSNKQISDQITFVLKLNSVDFNSRFWQSREKLAGNVQTIASGKFPKSLSESLRIQHEFNVALHESHQAEMLKQQEKNAVLLEENKSLKFKDTFSSSDWNSNNSTGKSGSLNFSGRYNQNYSKRKQIRRTKYSYGASYDWGFKHGQEDYLTGYGYDPRARISSRDNVKGYKDGYADGQSRAAKKRKNDNFERDRRNRRDKDVYNARRNRSYGNNHHKKTKFD